MRPSNSLARLAAYAVGWGAPGVLMVWIVAGTPIPDISFDLRLRTGDAAVQEVPPVVYMPGPAGITWLFSFPTPSGAVENISAVGLTNLQPFGTDTPVYYGAQGYGATVTYESNCARGTSDSKTWHMTSLDNGSGPAVDGSLRAILEDSIRFGQMDYVVMDTVGESRVGGSLLDIFDADACVWVAGQTGNGIVLFRSEDFNNDEAGNPYRFRSDASHILMEYIAVRPGEHPNGQDAITIGDSASWIRLHHISCSYAGDECIAARAPDPGTTVPTPRVQNDIGLDRIFFGYTYKASSLFQGVDGLSVINTAWNTMRHRMPRMSGVENGQVLNNAMYNVAGGRWTEFACEDCDPNQDTTFVDLDGVFYKVGPAWNSGAGRFIQFGLPTIPEADTMVIAYIGNYWIDSIKPDSAIDWTYVRYHDEGQVDSAIHAFDPYQPHANPDIAVTVWNPHQTWDSLVVAGEVGNYRRFDHEGRWVVRRDSIDQQQLNQMIARTGLSSFQDSSKFYFTGGIDGYPTLPVDTAFTDADRDGMSAGYEALCGLSDGDVDDAYQDADSDGRPNIEEYLMGANNEGWEVRWGKVTGADEYNVYWDSAGLGTWQQKATTSPDTDTTFTALFAWPGDRFTVRHVEGGNEGASSQDTITIACQ